MIKPFHIWLFKFDTKRQFTAFFKETYSDNKPLNKFAVSQGEDYYDHDWMETYYKAKTTTLNSFLTKNIPSDHIAAVQQLVKKKGITEVNGLVVFFGNWGEKPKSQKADPVIWYLGKFKKEALPPVHEDTGEIIKESWWTDFPTDKKELAALQGQSRRKKGQRPAAAKLATMYFCGILVKQDENRAMKYVKIARDQPELLHHSYLANGEAGYAEAWFQLFLLLHLETERPEITKEQLEYLEKAVVLGSIDAKKIMALELYRGYYLPDKMRDRPRALKLRHEIDEVTQDQASNIAGMYEYIEKPDRDFEKAIHWYTIEFNRTGKTSVFSYLGDCYRQVKRTKIHRTLMCKYYYLGLCQKDKVNLEYRIDWLEKATVSELEAGRELAKEWIGGNGVAATDFKGELCDPYENYLIKRRKK